MFKRPFHLPDKTKHKSDQLVKPESAVIASAEKPGAGTAPTDRRWQWGGIQTRLTALILIITVPLLIGIAGFISSRAGARIESDANEDLRQNNEALRDYIASWLELNTLTLQEMVLLPDIVNMRANEQRPVLQAVAATHSYMYLVSTTDLSGMNIARNDEAKLTDYSDRLWFQNARDGAPVTFQSLIGRTTGQPALVVSMPIRNTRGDIIGVGMFAADLANLSEQTRVHAIGQSGSIYVVDANNMVLAHPDPAYTKDELRDFSEYPPVAALRRGRTGLISFTDENQVRWRAYVSALDNGWGIIAQQPEDEILAPVRQFQRVALTAILAGAVVMLILSWFAIRRALLPIRVLTSDVTAITAGELDRVVAVKSRDELGVLASAFNNMTAQLRGLIVNLEQRVAERTRALATVAEISAAASTILEIDRLLQEVTDLSKERFGLYHSHIYLLNETGDTLVLAAGAGEPGRRMVAEGRSIPLDREQSLVARAARERKGVTVNDVTQAPDFLPHPLLPETRSELAVPMISGETLIGVFDVQSDAIGRFTETDIYVQTTLASQIASAVQNARLYTQMETSRQEAQSLSEYAPEAIGVIDLETGLFTDPNANAEKLYGLSREELVKVGPAQMSPPKQPDGRDSTEKAMEKINEAMQGGAPIFEWVHRNAQGQDIPCEVRLLRLPGAKPRVRFSVTDITERKRLEELTFQRARQQEAINLITQRIQSAATVEAALQVAARELGRAVGKPTSVQLTPVPGSDGNQD